MPRWHLSRCSPRNHALNVLVALLLLAAVIDWRTYRIPNWLTVSGMVVGLLYNSIGPSPASGFWLALAGLGVGLVMLLPLYVLRVMGAGDVKLMAMVGAFLAVPGVIYAALYSLIAGGIVADRVRTASQGIPAHDGQPRRDSATDGLRVHRPGFRTGPTAAPRARWEGCPTASASASERPCSW